MPIKDIEERRKYHREWMKKRRETFFNDKECVNCGSTDDLELDHIDPALKESHRIWSWSQVRREAELAKCQVLCHDCHLVKTNKYKDDMQPHGDARYIAKSCRCLVCKDAHNKAKREYRNRKRLQGLPYK